MFDVFYTNPVNDSIFYACGGQKFSVFSFMLVYMTHLGKHKTLNVGAPAAKIQWQFYACLQDASRQAQNSKCWRTCGENIVFLVLCLSTGRIQASTKHYGPPQARKIALQDIAEGICIKNSPPQAEIFQDLEVPFTFRNVFFLRISNISGIKISKNFRLRRASDFLCFLNPALKSRLQLRNRLSPYLEGRPPPPQGRGYTQQLTRQICYGFNFSQGLKPYA